MTTPDHLTRFLAAAAKAIADRPMGGVEVRPFITISRQSGAGGRTVARAILQQAAVNRTKALFGGWSLFDDRLAQWVAEHPSLKVSLKGLAEEEFISGIQDMVSSWIGGLSPQSVVAGHLFKVIRGMASTGKVIVVGRGGCCLTRHIPGGLHVRLVCPLTARVHRIMALNGLSEKAARRLVEDRDRDRAAFVKSYFHRDIEDPLLYDMVLNTETVSASMAAKTILRAVEAL